MHASLLDPFTRRTIVLAAKVDGDSMEMVPRPPGRRRWTC